MNDDTKSKELTKEQIMAIPNRREREKAIAENIELFNCSFGHARKTHEWSERPVISH